MKEKNFLLSAFLIALIIRVIFVFQVKTIPLANHVSYNPTYDQQMVNSGAESIAKGDWLLKAIPEPTTSLFYYYFLAVCFKLFNFSFLAVRVIQAFLGASVCIILYLIGKEAFNKATAIISCLIACLYGPFIFYTHILLRDTLLVFLNSLLLFLLIKLSKKLTLKDSFFSGAVCGLSFVSRENFLIFFIVIWLLFSLRKLPLKRISAIFALFVAGITVIFAPFLVRNYIVLNKFEVSAVRPAEGFWIGNTYDSPGVDLRWLPSFNEMKAKSQNSLKKTILLFIQEVKKRPKNYLKLYTRKFSMYLNGYEVPANLNYYLFKEFPTILRLPWISFTFICPFALLGIFLGIFYRKKLGILYLFLISLSSIIVFSHIQARYRIPAIPLFILFAGYGVSWYIQKIKEKDYNLILLSSLTLIPIFIFVWPDPSYRGIKSPDWVRPPDYINLAASYVSKLDEIRADPQQKLPQGFYGDAVKYLSKAAELDTQSKDASLFHFYLGSLYLQNGEREKAKYEWEESLKLNPDSKATKVNLSLLRDNEDKTSEYYQRGMKLISERDYNGAIKEFQNQLKESPGSINALTNLGICFRATGKIPQAISSYEEAIKNNPEALPPRYNLAMLFLSQNREQEAISQLEYITGIFPDYFLAQFYLAGAYLKAGLKDKALKGYQDFIGTSTNDPAKARQVEIAKKNIATLQKN